MRTIAVLLAAFGTWVLAGATCHADDLQQLFNEAIADAQTVAAERVSRNLVALTPDQPRLQFRNGGKEILVATAREAFEARDGHAYYANDDEYWVTAVPELREFYAAHWQEFLDDKRMRLQQLLGLSPKARYTRIVEFWVNVEDLFRPSPDPEVSDRVAELDFPPGTSKAHRDWFDSFRARESGNFPWTRLGYTYDWSKASPKHVGLSEFVIRKKSRVEVKHVYCIDEYLK